MVNFWRFFRKKERERQSPGEKVDKESPDQNTFWHRDLDYYFKGMIPLFSTDLRREWARPGRVSAFWNTDPIPEDPVERDDFLLRSASAVKDRLQKAPQDISLQFWMYLYAVGLFVTGHLEYIYDVLDHAPPREQWKARALITSLPDFFSPAAPIGILRSDEGFKQWVRERAQRMRWSPKDRHYVIESEAGGLAK